MQRERHLNIHVLCPKLRKAHVSLSFLSGTVTLKKEKEKEKRKKGD